MATQVIRARGLHASPVEIREAVVVFGNPTVVTTQLRAASDVQLAEAEIWNELDIDPSEDLGRAFSRDPQAVTRIIRRLAESTVALRRKDLQ